MADTPQLEIAVENGNNPIILTRSEITSVSYALSTSFDGGTVYVDEFSAVIRAERPDFLSAWTGVSRANNVWLTYNGRSEKYFFSPPLRRVGKYEYQITAQSPLGRLAADFAGDLYNGVPLPRVLSDVLRVDSSAPIDVGREYVVPYSVNPALASILVYGWAPYQSRRETLHALVLAYGFVISRDADRNLYFTVPDTAPYPIADGSIFTGGSVAYSVGGTYARAEITANDYRAEDSAAAQTIFDNSGASAVENLLVKFDAPMFGLSASGNLRVSRSGVNYAIVSGAGVLSGKPYARYTSVVSVPGDRNADDQHILSVTDAPLITSLNADSVGERLLSYHNAPATVTMDIVRDAQRSGDYVSFTDPFGDPRTGYITSLSGSITSFDRASASVVCGYTPSWGSAYDAVDVLTGSDTWTAPDHLNGKTVRVVLIGGGQGGASGQHGTDANGTGSRHGFPGGGGNVYDVKLTVSAGQTFQYSAGSGGAGGAQTDSADGSSYISNPGAYGTDSAFGDYSSADGAPVSGGFLDIIDGIRYATQGPDNGVDGGGPTSGAENGDRELPAYADLSQPAVTLPWDTAQSWTAGGAGDGGSERVSTPDGPAYIWAYGGLGGGAAVGSDGGSGGNGRIDFGGIGGEGGSGADALPIFPADTRTPGSGGSGGHGGGQSGKGGSAHADEGAGASQSVPGPDGSGGSGSAGQPGANGCILVYYKKAD